jgi:tryptophan-rich sensory protein
MDKLNVRGAVDSLANSRGRSATHLLVGFGLMSAVVAASALIARANAPTDDNPKIYAAYQALEHPRFTPPRPVFGYVWPPLFVALTMSGLRIWNAPNSPARSQALTLWGAIQGLNALWMALGPRRLASQLATAIATLAAAAVYLWRAGRVDAPAAGIATPYVGWISFANVLTEELWRKNRDNPTIH